MSFTYPDIYLVGGMRTAFAEYRSVLRDVSATDLGIAAARVDRFEINEAFGAQYDSGGAPRLIQA